MKKKLALFLLTYLLCILDSYIVRFLDSHISYHQTEVIFNPACEGQIEIINLLSENEVLMKNKKLECDALAPLLEHSTMALVAFNSYKGNLNINGVNYSIKENKPLEILKTPYGLTYVKFRLFLNVIFFILVFFFLKKSLDLSLFILISNSIVLLFFPGGFSLDVIDYVSEYQVFPYLEDFFSLTRLLPFFVINFFTGDLQSYKIFQLVLCNFSLWQISYAVIASPKYAKISFLALSTSIAYIAVSYSYTDFIFTALFLLKISLLYSLSKHKKNLYLYLFVSTIVIFYRSNSFPLVLFDIIFLKRIKVTTKQFSIYLVLLLSFLFSEISFVKRKETGYINYAFLYELVQVYEKKESKLSWIKKYVKIDTVVAEKKYDSLISAFYRGDSIHLDLIDREKIASDSKIIFQKYLKFSLEEPLLIIQVKFNNWMRFLGVGLGNIDYYLKNPPHTYFFYNNAQVQFLLHHNYLYFDKFLTAIHELPVTKLLFEVESYPIIYFLIICALLIRLLKNRCSTDSIALILTIYYSLVFLSLNHGYLLNYSYFLIIVAKLYLFKFIIGAINVPSRFTSCK